MACVVAASFYLFLQTQRTHMYTLPILSIPTPFSRYSHLHPLTTSITTQTALPTFPPLLCSPLSSTSIDTPPSIKQDNEQEEEKDDPQTENKNAVAEFLLKECGFSSSEVTKVMNKSMSRTIYIETAREAVQILKETGLTQAQIKRAIVKCPSIISFKVHGQLKPRIQFLKALGFTGNSVAYAIDSVPTLLSPKLEKSLSTRISRLENLFGSWENMCKAFRMSPGLLVADVDKSIMPKLDILKQCGLQGKLLSHLLSQHPSILTKNSVEALKLKIEYVKKMDISEGSTTFIYALFVVTVNGPENLENKLKLMASLGLSEDDIHHLIRKYPLVFNFSTDKIQKNMDFLTHTVGLPPAIVLSYPYLLGYSVEKRLKPRYEAFKVLSATLPSAYLPSLPSLLNVREQNFLETVKRNPEAATLYEMYGGKSVT